MATHSSILAWRIPWALLPSSNLFTPSWHSNKSQKVFLLFHQATCFIVVWNPVRLVNYKSMSPLLHLISCEWGPQLKAMLYGDHGICKSINVVLADALKEVKGNLHLFQWEQSASAIPYIIELIRWNQPDTKCLFKSFREWCHIGSSLSVSAIAGHIFSSHWSEISLSEESILLSPCITSTPISLPTLFIEPIGQG